jgi:hypothetical protein
MKAQSDNSLEGIDQQPLVREYTVEIAPRSWWGRTIVVTVAVALLGSALLFFSLLIAIGAALIAFTVVIGLLKHLAGGQSGSGRPHDQNRSSVIDTERSDDDGVYRPRDDQKR